MVITLKWNTERTLEQRHLYRSAPVLIKLTCRDLEGGIGIWYDLSQPSMKMKDDLIENTLLDAKTKPKSEFKLNLSPTPDPVSGFSWAVSEENEQFWKVQKNLFYKTFQIYKTSCQLEELKSKAFDFNEYSKFIEDDKKFSLDKLDDRIKTFLPFEKNEFNKDFGKWQRDYTKTEDKKEKVQMNLAGIAWLEELKKSDTRLDDTYKKFIKDRIRKEDDKTDKPVYRKDNKPDGKETDIQESVVLKESGNPINAREFFPVVLNTFNQNKKEMNKDKADGYFMLVKYFEKCLEMDKLKDAPKSFPTGVITKEVKYEFTFPNTCFFVDRIADFHSDWYKESPMLKDIKTSLGISLEKPVEKPDFQEQSTQ